MTKADSDTSTKPFRAWCRKNISFIYLPTVRLLYGCRTRFYNYRRNSPFGVFLFGGVENIKLFWPIFSAAKPVKAIQSTSPLEIVMLVISEVWRDPRVEREARALATAGFRVKVIYPEIFSPQIPDWGAGISFRPIEGLIGHYSFYFPYLFGSDFLKAALEEKPFAYHGHDLSTCVVALAAAIRNNAYCVCDFHEWYSENVTWHEKPKEYRRHTFVKKFLYRWAERLMLRKAACVITVCDSLANEIAEMVTPARHVAVVRNIPRFKVASDEHQMPTLRQQLGISPEKFIVLYQGGTGPSRMIESIIDAIALVPEAVLVIRGPGNEFFGEGYLKQARALGIEDRVHVLAPVPSAQVVEAARSADVGIWTLPNLCKNFNYALPNKIFEYLTAGLPVLVAHYPEARRLVEKYSVGLCFDPYSTESIAAQIRSLANNKELHAKLKANVPSALSDLNADREWDRVVDIYRGLVNGRKQ